MTYKTHLKQACSTRNSRLKHLPEWENHYQPSRRFWILSSFAQILEPVFAKENRKSNAGRRGLDPVFMMKAMFLQRLYGLGNK